MLKQSSVVRLKNRTKQGEKSIKILIEVVLNRKKSNIFWQKLFFKFKFFK